MSNLLDERDKRTKNRKKIKKEVDALINLSVSGDENKVILAPREGKPLETTHRLLDEGAILYADGEIDCFIIKGTLEKYLSGKNEYLTDFDGNIRNLTDDYVGTINYGHHDLATDPIALIGEWKKEDLHLVDIGDGRKALDVDVKLNEEHIYVKQLKNLDYAVGLSAEFWCHYDEEKSEEFGFGVIDEIFIGDFAVVGECGNVNSSDLRLKGGLKMPQDMKELNAVDEIMEDEIVEEIAEISEETETNEEIIETAEKDAEIEEEAVETAEEDEETEQVEDTEETDDEVIGDEDEEVEETEDEEDDVVSELIETVKELKKENASLKEENASLKKSNNRLNKKLKARNEEAKQFIADFKGLSVEMGITKDEPKEVGISKAYLMGDGIGE